VLAGTDWGTGRVFSITMGHDPKACEQESFQQLLIRGALWAAGTE
jgi:type 1 glutamine amidotransferase